MTKTPKITSNLEKYSKYLFILGSCLCIIGIVARLVSGSWSWFPILLVVVGGLTVVLWLGSLDRGFWGRRSTRSGTNAFIATLAVLIILGLGNFLASRYPIRLDLTENQLFTLSPQSRQVVKKLEQPLEVLVFTRNPDSGDRQLLENYRRYSPNFQFQFVDPQIEIGLGKEFNVRSMGEVHLKSGSKKLLVQTVNEAESLSEIKLTNALEKIQRDRNSFVYLLQGHGEPSLEAGSGGLYQAVMALQEKGYEIEPLNLARNNAIPDNASAIVLAGPKRPLLSGEARALEAYLKKGGRVLLMLDPDVDAGLESFLKNWGIKLDDRTIIDVSGAAQGLRADTALINDYGDHPITSAFQNGLSIYPGARAIVTSSVSGVSAAPLLITNQQTWAESQIGSQVNFDPAKDAPGPLNIGFALTRTISPTESSKSSSPPSARKPEKPKESRLVVLGDSDFATDTWFREQLNQDVLINSINWLANDGEDVLSVSPKEPKNRRLRISPDREAWIEWMALRLVPLSGLILFGITWWRRR